MQGAETMLFYGLWSDHNKSWCWCFSHSDVSPEVRLCVVFRMSTTHATSNRNIPLGRLVTGAAMAGGGWVWVATQTFFLLVQQECQCVLEWSTRIHISESDTRRRLVLQGSIRSADVNTDAFPSNSSQHTVINYIPPIYLNIRKMTYTSLKHQLFWDSKRLRFVSMLLQAQIMGDLQTEM
jgi:hypothetical protein